MKYHFLISSLFGVLASQAWSAHWILVSETQPASPTFTLNGSNRPATGNSITDSAMVAGPLAIYGTQTVSYYGYSVHYETLNPDAISLLAADEASAQLVFKFQYVKDSPSDPAPSITGLYPVNGYNLRTDSTTYNGLGAASITGTASCTHIFPASNTFSVYSPTGAIENYYWPISPDPSSVYGASGTYYDFQGDPLSTDASITTSGGIYYANVVFTFTQTANVSLNSSAAIMLREGVSDEDLIGISQIWSYPVQY